MATINGTAGNDVIAAHPDSDYAKGGLSFVLGATPAQGGWPTPDILINGQVVASHVLVNSNVFEGHTQVVSVGLPPGGVSSVGIRFTNDLVIPGGEDRNIYVGSVTLNGVTLDIASATYVRDDFPTTTGRTDMNWNGTMTWTGAQVAAAMAGGTGVTSNAIDGGAGTDTVTYVGREHGNYNVQFTGSASLSVTGGAWGTDTLNNVENVLFDDRNAYGGGFDAVIDPVAKTIDGGRGLDTLVLGGNHTQYIIHHTTTGFSITGNGVDEWVTNVERLKFNDGYVLLDTSLNGGQAYRLYQAAFDRAPDVGGLGFQANQLDSGRTLASVAADFLASPEFQSKYGNVDDATYVGLLYQHVLHRTAAQDEINYHVNQELHNGYSRAEVLTFFSESPENQANVIGAIQDGAFYTLG